MSTKEQLKPERALRDADEAFNREHPHGEATSRRLATEYDGSQTNSGRGSKRRTHPCWRCKDLGMETTSEFHQASARQRISRAVHCASLMGGQFVL
jgi:hypothetical protein